MQPSTTSSADALSQLQSTQASAQDPNSILQAQNQALGVDNAQQTVTGLRGAINNTTKLLQQVAPSVMGRTGNSLVTNAQATKQISNEQAPINQNLSSETSQYNQASQDLSQLEQKAQQQATGIYQGQQNKVSYLQNLYNSLYGQEQDAAKSAEAQREFNVSEQNKLSAAKITAGSNYLPTSSTNSGSSAPAAFSAYKNGQNGSGGTNFTDANGQAISAAKYAQLTGQNIATVLQKMGQSGDKYAQQAYNEIAANQGYYSKNPNILKNEFSALFWGA